MENTYDAIITAHNSRFSQLRILLKPVVDFPLENLILAESTQFRTSQLTRSRGTLAVFCRKL
jgi:hypothetical protein